MGWLVAASFAKLDLSEDEIKALQRRKASRSTLRKIAKLDPGQIVADGLTHYFQFDSDVSNEVFDREFPNGRRYEFGKLTPEIHVFSSDEAEKQWKADIAEMKKNGLRKYNELTAFLQQRLGRQGRRKLTKAKSRIKWTITLLPEGSDWRDWNYTIVRDDSTNPINDEHWPRDRSYDVEINLEVPTILPT